MESVLSFDSTDALRDFLKDIYESDGITAVREWVKKHLHRDIVLMFKEVPAGQKESRLSVWDRSMELLDPASNTAVDESFLPLLSTPVDFDKCELYLSLRVLFIPEPFGIIIYKRRNE